MSELKGISTLVFKNYPETNFILWFFAIISSFFTSRFKNFLNILFQLAPEFLQNYLRHIHISSTMLYELYLSVLNIFLFSFFFYFFGKFIFPPETSLQENNWTIFCENFILLLSTSLLTLHLLIITINSSSNFFSLLFNKTNSCFTNLFLLLETFFYVIVGFYASCLIPPEEEPKDDIKKE